MAAAVTLTPASPQAGKPVVIAGTGFAVSHAVTVQIEELGITLDLTTDNTGAFTTSGNDIVVPQTDHPLDLVVSDGTSTVTQHILVSSE